MLGKRTLLAIGKFPDTSFSVDRTGSPDLITSPKSPLECKIRSPRGLKNAVTGSGVGLGIVAALEISGTADGQTPAKFIVGSLNLTRSEPIPIGIKTSPTRYRRGVVEVEESEIGCCENYTCVTSHHGPNNKSVTRVFFDGDEFGGGGGGAWRYSGVSYGSPAATEEVVPAYPSSSFLSSCYLCRETLHGRDIYMYRGEKAFCSAECRYKQIVSDERKEKCGSEASRSTDIAVSPYTGGQLFFTGITAA